MNWFLKGFYSATKVLVNFSFSFFFRKTTILNEERLNFENPCILVSNHPSALFDPLVYAVRAPRFIFFLANYSLFKTPFQNWFFNTFYCIPIKRKEDVGIGNLNNRDSMDKAEIHLSKNGCLYIAPEGNSHIERRIGKVKTGAARIALGAEKKNNYELGLTILPAGINYEDQTRFRKKVVVEIGEPIQVADFQNEYDADSEKGIRSLTDAVEEQLRALTIDIPNVTDSRAFRQIEEILENDSELEEEQFFLKTKQLSKTLFEKPDFEADKAGTLFFNKHLRAWRLSDEVFKNPQISIKEILLLLIGLPVFLWGTIHNFFPYFIGKFLSENNKFHIVYKSTVKLLGGFVLVLIFYSIQTGLVHFFFRNGWVTLAYFLLLIPAGVLAYDWKELFNKQLQKLRFRSIRKERPDLVQKLIICRKAIKEKITSY